MIRVVRKFTLSIAGLLFALSILVACAASEAERTITASSSEFDGLPQSVVQERFADLELLERIAGLTYEERAGILQLNVASAIFCRDIFHQYIDWTTNGSLPTVPEIATPFTPGSNFQGFMDAWVESVTGAIQSGNPAELRNWIEIPGGCESFVVDPDNSTKTISDILE